MDELTDAAKAEICEAIRIVTLLRQRSAKRSVSFVRTGSKNTYASGP